jgi:hypothetical protein
MLCYVLAERCLQTFFAVRVTALGVLVLYSLEKSHYAPETWGFFQAIQYSNTKAHTLHSHHCENLRSNFLSSRPIPK